MPQGPSKVQLFGQTPGKGSVPLQTDDNGYLAPTPRSSALNITASTRVKSGKGILLGLIVTVAGTAAGTANDLNDGSAASAPGNLIAPIPNTAGNVPLPHGGVPFTNGLVIKPGTGQSVVAIFG